MLRNKQPAASDSGPSRTWNRLGSPVLLGGLALLALLPFALRHDHGRFDVETDFFSEYGPYARSFRAGRIPESFPYRGPGYHLALALLGFVVPDLFMAGKFLSLACATALVGLTALAARRIAGPRAAALAGLFCLIQPVVSVFGWSVGNDVFFAALCAGGLVLLQGALLEKPGGGERFLRSLRHLVPAGLLTGAALLTRPNGAFLPVAGVLALGLFDPTRPLSTRLRRMGVFLLAVALPLAFWLLSYHAAHGHLPRGAGYRNVLGILHTREINLSADVYRQNVEKEVDSFGTLVSRHGVAILGAALGNIPLYLGHNARTVHGMAVALLAGLGGLLLLLRRDLRHADAALLAAGALAFAALLFANHEPRFGTVLVPPVALLAALLFVTPGSGTWRVWPGVPDGFQASARGFVGAAAIVATAGTSVQLAQRTLDAEIISAGDFEAGRFLSTRPSPPGAVAARKPHSAWAAGRDYRGVPVGALADLPDSLRARGVAYLQYGPAEIEFLPQYHPLFVRDGIPAGLRLVWLVPGWPPRALYEVLPAGDPTPPVPDNLAPSLDQLGQTFTRSGLKDRVLGRLGTDEFLKGRIHLENGRPALALTALRAAIQSLSEAPAAAYLLGVAALGAGSWAEGYGALTRAAAAGFRSEGLDFSLAHAAFGLGHRDECERRLDQFQRTYPGRAPAIYLKALLRGEQGRAEEAHQLLATARAAGTSDTTGIFQFEARLALAETSQP